MISVNRSTLAADLRALGIAPGQHVLLHSSLSSLGFVEGGADAVIDALIDVLGPAGTLLVPTLTGSEALSPAAPPRFDPVTTPCWTGRIPETLRRREGAIRSLHPTHSVAALGVGAERFTVSHTRSVTPCDEWSPYGLLARDPAGRILLLGVTHASNTTMHHVEELVGVGYHMQPGFAVARIVIDGIEHVRHVMLHRYGQARDFERMEPVLIERGAQRNGTVGAAIARLINAPAMVAIVAAVLRVDHTALCKAGAGSPGEIA